MKSRIIIILVSFGFIISVNGCGLMGKKYLKSKSEQHQISTLDKKKIKISNITGNIVLSHSNDTAMVTIKASKEIKVKKKYLDTPFDEITIDIDTLSSIIEIKSVISGNDDGVFKFNNNRDIRIDYEIYIPSNIDIEVENVHGNITSGDLNNDIKIDLVHGDVDLENYTGRIDCEITNGSFSGKIDSTKGIDLNTINGNVTLILSNYMNVNLRAETVNGRISNENLDFRLVDKERNIFKGKLGNSDLKSDIKIETVNGKIKLFGRNEI